MESSATGNKVIRRFGKPMDMTALGRTIEWRKKACEDLRRNAAKAVFAAGRRERCPICDSMKSTFYVTVNNIEHVSCDDCGHIYYTPILDEDAIRNIYEGENAYLETYNRNVFATRLKLIAHPKAEFIAEAWGGPPDGEWLDIGSGGCELLAAAKNLGWQTRGLEAGAGAVERGRELGILVENEFITLENAQRVVRAPRIVSMLNILEHVFDPFSFLHAVTRVLPQDTVVAIELPRHPSLSDLSVRLFPENVTRYATAPDHLHIFSEKSLEILLEKAGLRLTHLWTFGQDFYETVSAMTMKAGKEMDIWPRELITSMNSVQEQLDRNGLSDCMLAVTRKK